MPPISSALSWRTPSDRRALPPTSRVRSSSPASRGVGPVSILFVDASKGPGASAPGLSAFSGGGASSPDLPVRFSVMFPSGRRNTGIGSSLSRDSLLVEAVDQVVQAVLAGPVQGQLLRVWAMWSAKTRTIDCTRASRGV